MMKRLLTASTILIGAAALASTAYADNETTNIGGSGNSVTVNQASNLGGTNSADNDIGGTFGPSDNNSVTVNQANPIGVTQSSTIDINIANSNVVGITQSGNADKDATSAVTIRSGADGNEVTVSQTGNSAGSTESATSVVDINDNANDGNGDDNDVNVTQNNSLNVHSDVAIVGQNNLANVNQQNAVGGGPTTATISLTGNNNGRDRSFDGVGDDAVVDLGVVGVNIFQNGTGANTSASIDITGTGNDAQIEQNANTQVATIEVLGGNNNQLLVRQTVNASGASASISIAPGSRNTVFTNQNALDVISSVSIEGNENYVTHAQNADSASAIDTIVGNNNTVSVNQN